MVKVKVVKSDFSRDMQRMIRKMPNIVDRALMQTAQEIVANLQKVTSTWNDKPKFNIRQSKGKIEVTTDNAVFHYLNEGTPEHMIYPRASRGRNKRARALSFLWTGQAGDYHGKSEAGSFNPDYAFFDGHSATTFYFREVHHPGIAPRMWSNILSAAYENDASERVQQELDYGLEAAGL